MTNETTEMTELVITREFNAPRDLVWKAWTEPEHFKQWYGPEGFTIPLCEIDLRVGGKRHIGMESPGGGVMYMGGEILEIDPPQRLVFIEGFLDKDGNSVPPSTYGIPDEWPADCRIEITLEESDGKTTMTVRQGPMPAGPMTEGASAGWNQAFDKLGKLLAV